MYKRYPQSSQSSNLGGGGREGEGGILIFLLTSSSINPLIPHEKEVVSNLLY